MPLRTSEVAQCQACESYSRLGELLDVRIQQRTGAVLVKRTKHADRGGLIGRCPKCGEDVCQRDIG